MSRQDCTHNLTAGYEVLEATGLGVPVDALPGWRPLRPMEISWAMKHGLSPEQSRAWAAQGLSAYEAARALMLGLSSTEVARWTAAGFAPSDAVDSCESGITIESAIAWREAGFILPDAELLFQEGWTLDAATRARYIDVNHYDCGT